MQNYAEWLNNKLYEGHIERIAKIKDRNNTINKSNKKSTKSQRKFRIRSQPSLQIHKSKQCITLPLVSKKQKTLLTSVLNGKCINLKQKQQLLQNYLLSKRILQTNSVFNSKQLKKQFLFHKKVSSIMNRNLQSNRKTFSELRDKRNSLLYHKKQIEFSQLVKLKQQNVYGIGKHQFALKITEIIIIKRKLQENNNSKFNLIFKPDKMSVFSLNSLSFTQLINKKNSFKVNKKQILNQKGIKFQIQQIRGNQTYKLCFFHIVDLKQLFNSLNSKQLSQNNPENINNYQQKQQKYIYKLYHPIMKNLIGSIKIYLAPKTHQNVKNNSIFI